MIIADAVFEALQHERDELLRCNEQLQKRNAELERLLGERNSSAEATRPEPLRMYEALFEQLSIPVLVFKAEGSLVAINRAGEEMLRVNREMVIGRYNVFQDPESAAQGITACFARAAAGETMTMPPVPYSTAKAGFERHEDRVTWTSSTYLPMEVGEERYVAGVHMDVTPQKIAEQAAREREGLLKTIVNNAPMLIYAKDLEGRYMLASRRAAEATGLSADALLGKSDFDLFPREVAESFLAKDRELLETQQPISYDESMPDGDGFIDLYTIKFPLFDAEGKLYGVCGMSADITERRRGQEKYRKLQEEMLRMKEAALRALSTPLIPIARGVLVMPLIGDIDQDRSRQVLETLLRGVAQNRARVAILDVTGVQNVGIDVADSLVQVGRAVGLLGAQVVLTGVQPAMAQALATLGTDLSGVITRGTLENGIIYAMKARAR